MKTRFRAKEQSIWDYYLQNSLLVSTNKDFRILKTDGYNENEDNPIKGGIAYNVPGKVTVLEYDSSVVKSLKEKWNKKIDLIQGDIRNLPFEDDQFDVLIDLSTIDHIPPSKLADVIENYARVLKKGGTILLFSWCSSFSEDLKETDVWDPTAQFYFKKGLFVNHIKKHFNIKEKESFYPSLWTGNIVDKISCFLNPGRFMLRIIAEKK